MNNPSTASSTSNEAPVLNNSAEWCKILNVIVMDPDGWDRKNFDVSWAELITEDEFRNRKALSTVRMVN